jgi:hypothetical protein
MALISGLLCEVSTSDISGAGTDGTIYLGIAGREFHIDSRRDDYERGSVRDYVLGEPPIGDPGGFPDQVRVNNPERNDPRLGFPLDTDDLARAPVYLRFEPEGDDDNWNVNFAAALVYTNHFVSAYMPPQRFENLWLGHSTGKILYLTFEFRMEARTLADARKSIADRLGKTLRTS